MAQPTAQSTGVLAAGTTTVFAGRHTVNSIQLFGDGVNAATVNIYDNTTNSGKIAAKLTLPAATSSMVQTAITFRFAVRVDTALTVEVIGTNATAIVTFGAA